VSPGPKGARRRSRTQEEVSAGGIVMRRTTDGLLFLVIRDSYRNWGFPKGHLEPGESASDAALREVAEETGLAGLKLVSEIESIDWYFRFRGTLIHKVCHFFLLETDSATTTPQRDEGITACRWEPFAQASELVSYDNAREVLRLAFEIGTRGVGT
jgi:8-oxo-dGTP pyrophosphatase MutT (NUDIX family)